MDFKRRLSVIAVLIITIFASLFITSCGSEQSSSDTAALFTTISDVNGTPVAVPTGSVQEAMANKAFPDSRLEYYPDFAQCLTAVSIGKASAAICPIANIVRLQDQFPDLTYFDEALETTSVHFCFPQNDKGELLKGQMNEYLSNLTASGKLEQIRENWMSGTASGIVFDYSLLPAVNGTIQYASMPIDQPFFCYQEDGYTGYEAELLYSFCQEYGYAVNINILDISTSVAGLNTGTLDMADYMVYTDERAKSMLFSHAYLEIEQVVVVPSSNMNVVSPEYPDTASLEGKRAALYTGSVNAIITEECFPNCEGSYYATFTDCLLSVSEGKTDFTVMNKNLYRQMSKQYSNLTCQEKILKQDSLYFGIIDSEFGQMLQSDLTEYLERLAANDELDKISEYWSSNTDNNDVSMYDFSELKGSKGTIRFAMEPLDAPYGHMIGNKWTGIESQLIYDFAREYDYSVDIELIEFSSILTGINSNKIDLTGYFGYSDERAETVLYSPAYTNEDYVVVVRATGSEQDNTDQTLIEKLASGIEKNFIRENRWKLMLQGLWTTIQISLLSGFFGTILGIILCLIRRSKIGGVSAVCRTVVRFIQGIPIVVILLVLYYIIFADSSINPVLVGVIGFSIDFGVYVSEILRSGIEAVDLGQWEAARVLGLNKVQTYCKIILPQAINVALPVYKGQFVSMVKMTSVVGYIAVQDLTKVSDIIRSRTYDAFMPILATCILYFLLAWVLTLVITHAEFCTDPTKRKNILKNVDTKTEILGHFVVEHPASDSGDIIKIEHLTKVYDLATPLQDVSASIRNRDVVAIIGPSGTGKSTLLRCIIGLDLPTQGEISVLGQKMDIKSKEYKQIRMKVGMVFQSFNLFGHLTVIENLMLAPVLLKKASRQEAYENGIRLLRSVGLADKAFAYPNELSGGQKQRIAIIRAVAMSPDVLLFDEPTSALDPTMINEVLHVIKELAETGMTILIVTHEMKFARDVSNRVFYMDRGQIYEDGPTEQVFDEPKRELTRAFINRIKYFHYTVESKYYDYLEFATRFDVFARSQLISQKHINNTILTLEELLFSPTELVSYDCYPVEYRIGYTEDEKLEVKINYRGKSINWLDHMDKLSQSIFNYMAYDQNYSRLPNGTNEIRFFVRND